MGKSDDCGDCSIWLTSFSNSPLSLWKKPVKDPELKMIRKTLYLDAVRWQFKRINGPKAMQARSKPFGLHSTYFREGGTGQVVWLYNFFSPYLLICFPTKNWKVNAWTLADILTFFCSNIAVIECAYNHNFQHFYYWCLGILALNADATKILFLSKLSQLSTVCDWSSCYPCLNNEALSKSFKYFPFHMMNDDWSWKES